MFFVIQGDHSFGIGIYKSLWLGFATVVIELIFKGFGLAGQGIVLVYHCFVIGLLTFKLVRIVVALLHFLKMRHSPSYTYYWYTIDPLFD